MGDGVDTHHGQHAQSNVEEELKEGPELVQIRSLNVEVLVLAPPQILRTVTPVNAQVGVNSSRISPWPVIIS